MKRSRLIIVLCLLAVIATLVWWLTHSQKQSENPQREETATHQSRAGVTATPKPSLSADDERKKQQALEKVTQAFTAPIAFYGKVIDQSGNPVPDAEVGYTAADKFNGSGSSYTGKSDARGLFEISGIQGAGLGVGVRKQGYYPVADKYDKSPSSSAIFAYGMGPDSVRRAAPTKENPAIFLLHKAGETEPLVKIEQSARIPKNGTPTTVNLRTAQLSAKGDCRIEAWTEEPTVGRKFSWRCRLTVRGGGLVERKRQFDFVAPKEGYEESVELGMPQDAEQWTSQQQRNFFIKLSDGRYARINFRMIAGGNHYFVLESYLNPKPGSRNLEFDPTKAVKSP